jgi:demethoxyubiquinone hydroxylase (CLK1/Coq7/Cat5 family)
VSEHNPLGGSPVQHRLLFEEKAEHARYALKSARDPQRSCSERWTSLVGAAEYAGEAWAHALSAGEGAEAVRDRGRELLREMRNAEDVMKGACSKRTTKRKQKLPDLGKP